MLFLPAVTAGFGQRAADAPERIVAFRFVPGKDMFYIPWAGNGAELDRLYALVDEYRHEIASGRMPVQVDGYCASRPTVVENLRTARVRANRVKSKLIVHKGLKEADFVTANYAHACDGNRDVVIVTLRIPANAESTKAPTVADEPRSEVPPAAQQPEPACEQTCEPACEQTCEPACEAACEPTSEPTCEQTCEPTCEPVSKPTCEPTCEQSSLRPFPEAQPAASTHPAAGAEPQLQPESEPQPKPVPQPATEPRLEPTDEAEATRLPPASVQAPCPVADRSQRPGPWSVGLHVGTPFFWGDMVTCSADGTRIGIMLGVEASYRINSLLGAFLSREWAQGRAGARDYAFYGCTNLKTVVLGDTLGGLPESCFEESGLVSIEIPKNVWSISKRAFFGCRKLESVVLDDDGLSEIGVSAFEECTSLKRIKIPRKITEIGPRTFYNCTSLTTLDLVEKEIGGASISIQSEAFAHCTSLIETAHTPGVLHLKHSIDGEYAFKGCTSLKTVILDNITSISYAAFSDCTGLEKVSFCEDLGRIDPFAFENTALKSISLPPYLYEIGGKVFDGCSDLTKIYSYMETPPLIDKYHNPFDPKYIATRLLFIPYSIQIHSKYSSNPDL